MTTILRKPAHTAKQLKEKRSTKLKELYREQHYHKNQIRSLDNQISQNLEFIEQAKEEKQHHAYRLHVIQEQIDKLNTYKIEKQPTNFMVFYLYAALILSFLLGLYFLS